MRYTDFLKDEQFLQWQIMSDESLDGYWNDFIRNNPEATEEFYRAIEYLKTKTLNKKTLDEESRTLLLNRILLTIDKNRKQTKIYRLMRYAASISAAVIFLFIGLYIYRSFQHYDDVIVGDMLSPENIQLITGKKTVTFQSDIHIQVDKKGVVKIEQDGDSPEETIEIASNDLNKLIVPYSKRSYLTLSDGSKIWLNSGSVLEFPSQFSKNKREIRLVSGEIYLEVAPDKDRQFYVQTQEFNVKVYGTKFNISAYTDAPASVTLIGGCVGLELSGRSELQLLPNEQAIYSEEGMFEVQIVNTDQIISWKNGYLSFDKMPVADILKYIERYYNFSFKYNKDSHLSNITCTGKIYLSENLDNVMTAISLLSSTNYERIGNRIYITDKTNE